MINSPLFTRSGLRSLSRRSRLIIFVVAVAGIGLRLGAMLFGNNFDYESYEIVGELQAEGENVYSWTGRYNYGPAWFLLLGNFWRLSQAVVGDAGLFRIQIVLVLIAADLLIAYLLLRRFGPAAGALFLLSPISIIITGFHNQFDNIAIAVGFMAILLIGETTEGKIERRQIAGIALVALSIIFKHILIFLPVWIGMRQRSWRRRLAFAATPLAVFALSFLPWIYDGWWGIYDNVIKYRSFSNAPLVDALTLGLLDAEALATVGFGVFVAGILGIGWWARRADHVTAFLVMLGAVVILAPAMANQFLAIPVAAMAAFPNAFFGLWTVVGTWFLIGDVDGLGFRSLLPPFLDQADVEKAAYNVPALLIATGGLVWLHRTPHRPPDAAPTVGVPDFPLRLSSKPSS
jgi:hypothetical protein